ncbi:Uncharacterised protein [Salmonella enterica subsp. enterica serovar Sanjuan]|uniref:Uncharacterized protein n=1 Tax=Salmonella enterica subsp. enterica serovar Sanjuan TaxID=1160765 RepID=A0A3S4FEF9_SALET|nr:Uncharacterised protein [Salmonella enterica subsp. enterica serovar Sanjuan]
MLRQSAGMKGSNQQVIIFKRKAQRRHQRYIAAAVRGQTVQTEINALAVRACAFECQHGRDNQVFETVVFLRGIGGKLTTFSQASVETDSDKDFASGQDEVGIVFLQ